MGQVKNLFHGQTSVVDHLKSQNENYQLYISVLCDYVNKGIDISVSGKSCALAASLSSNNNPLSKYLLTKADLILTDILKTCEILDSNRLMKQLNGKLTKSPHARQVVKGRWTSDINNLLLNNTSETPSLTLTSTRVKRIKQWWVRTIPADKLLFYALTFDSKPWKKLADILHLRDSDFQCDWFLQYICKGVVQGGTELYNLKSLHDMNLATYINEFQPEYSYLRTQVEPYEVSNASRLTIVGYSLVETAIWYWEDLRTPAVDELILKKINDTPPDLSYGKLMDRILIMRKSGGNVNLINRLIEVAEDKLSNMTLDIEQPVLVMGDASGSMQVAVNTSTIMASSLTATLDSKLHFFKQNDIPISNPPHDVKSCLALTDTIMASNATAPAASLFPYYSNKIVVKTIIVVTDEIENTNSHGDNFAHMYRKYFNEVYPARVVFITFKSNDNDGKMVTHLREMLSHEEFDTYVKQFRMDLQMPDLSKLDTIFAQIGTGNDDTIKLVNPADVLPNALGEYKQTHLDVPMKNLKNNKTPIVKFFV